MLKVVIKIMSHILEIRILWCTYRQETGVRDFMLFSVRYLMWPVGEKREATTFKS